MYPNKPTRRSLREKLSLRANIRLGERRRLFDSSPNPLSYPERKHRPAKFQQLPCAKAFSRWFGIELLRCQKSSLNVALGSISRNIPQEWEQDPQAAIANTQLLLFPFSNPAFSSWNRGEGMRISNLLLDVVFLRSLGNFCPTSP